MPLLLEVGRSTLPSSIKVRSYSNSDCSFMVLLNTMLIHQPMILNQEDGYQRYCNGNNKPRVAVFVSPLDMLL